MKKKWIAVGLVALGFGIFDGTVMFLYNIHKSLPLELLLGGAIATGLILGKLDSKWEREKRIASIVAERLLRKPEPLDVAGDMAKLQGQWAKGVLGNAIAAQLSSVAIRQVGAALLGGQATSNGQRTLASITGEDDGTGLGKR
jgi:hypothetical protein